MMWQEEEIESFKKSYTKLTASQFQARYNMQDRSILGDGAYGTVYKVTNPQGNELAIKEFKKQTSKRYFRQIIREVDNLRDLAHPNIARFYDCYIVDDKKYYIVMEYCQGGTLAEYLQTNILSVEDKIKLCKNIADGLAYAHQKKIVHRDLKPDNILIGRNNTAKISDFGCSTLSQNPQGSSNVLVSQIGTPAYMDLRMINGEPYDISTDIYSMGMIFVSIFKGSGIFDKCDSSRHMMEKRSQLSQDYENGMEFHLSSVPQVMKDIIKNCLQEDHTKRYKASDISSILDKQIDNNSSKMSKLLSTIDDEDIQDKSSLFAIGLIKYYKNIDKKRQNLATREKIVSLLHLSKRNMDQISVIQRLQYVYPDTKEQFTFFVLFYYFFWLENFQLLLKGQSSPFRQKYPSIVPQVIEKEVLEKALTHIAAQRGKYSVFLMKCCKSQKNKMAMNLIDPKKSRPQSFKSIVRAVATYNISKVMFNDYEDESLRSEVVSFFEKRVKPQFKVNCKKNDEHSLADLQTILSMCQNI